MKTLSLIALFTFAASTLFALPQIENFEKSVHPEHKKIARANIEKFLKQRFPGNLDSYKLSIISYEVTGKLIFKAIGGPKNGQSVTQTFDKPGYGVSVLRIIKDGKRYEYLFSGYGHIYGENLKGKMKQRPQK